ncbi:MAG: cation:proton antiporter [Akkermansiaceae bacterium]
MVDAFFFQSLGIIVIAAAVLVMAGRMIRMPAIVVYLLAGVLIGPTFDWVEMSPALELISETGIALLLFLVGLELSFAKIRDVGKVAVVAGIGQVALTGAVAYGACLLLGIPALEALFLSTAVTFSSTVVVVKTLAERGELNLLYGRISVGILLMQDLVVVVLLTMLAGLGGGDELDAAAVASGLGKAFGGMSLLLGLTWFATRHILPRPFRWASRAPDMLMIWALSWCFLMVLAAHWFGLSLEVGAFLAGLALAQFPYNEDLRRRVHPLMNLFVAVFFVTLGIRVSGEGLVQNMGTALVLIVLVLLLKPVLFLWINLRMGYDARTSFLSGITLSQISEFSFILVGLGFSRGLVSQEIFSITAIVGVGTIAVSSYLFSYRYKLHEWAERQGVLGWKLFQPRESVAVDSEPAHALLFRHVIVVGMNTLGRQIVKLLHERGERVLAVDTDPAKLENLPVHTLLGSVEYLSVLQEAGLERAKLLVSALRIEDANDLLAYRCQSAGIPSAIHVIDLSVVDNLLDLGADYLMIPKVDGVKEQVKILRKMRILQP